MPDGLKPESSAGTKPLPLPSDGIGSRAWWLKQLEASDELRQQKAPLWQENVDRYLAKTLKTAPTHDTIVVPKDFANVEQKKPQLFVATTEVQLSAELPGLDDAMSVFQPVLNHKLGPKGVNAAAAVDECLFDLLCPAGIAAVKVGYEFVQDGTKPVQTGMEPDPEAMAAMAPEGMMPGAMPPDPVMGAQPQADPMMGGQMGGQAGGPMGGAPMGGPMGPTPAPAPSVPMRPTFELAPNIIFERYFCERISPNRLRIPHDFHGSDYDKASWLGFDFTMDRVAAQRAFGLSDEDTQSLSYRASGTALSLNPDVPSPDSRESDVVSGTEIWYKASRVDSKVKHPERQRVIVWLDGLDRPAAHKDSPCQRFNPDGTWQTGMTGFPISVVTLRYVSDSAYPPSDCTMSRILVDELSKGRTQMILQRERSIPMRIASLLRIGGEAGLNKIQKNIWNGIIPIDDFDPNAPPVMEISRGQFPSENFRFNEISDRDISEVWAMGSTQRGLETENTRTATEMSLMQGATQVRLEAERARVLAWYVHGIAEKLGALIQLWADEPDYVEIVGPDGAKRLQQWDKTRIQGRFAYSAKPDSAIRIDAAQDRAMALDLYQRTAQDPQVNRVELLNALFRKHNLDPSKLVSPQPPEKGPEPPKVSYAIKIEDFTGPGAHIAMKIAAATGLQITPEDIAQAQTLGAQYAAAQAAVDQTVAGQGKPQTEHPGSMPEQPMLSKHQSDRTGGMQGTGMMTPTGPGGGMVQ